MSTSTITMFPDPPPNRRDDACTRDLLHLVCRGDRHALGVLFDRYYELVRKVARHRLGRGLRQLMDSNDVLQETFVHATRNFDRFEPRGNGCLFNWLARIAETTIMGIAKYFRACKRDTGRALSAEDDLEQHGIEVSDRGPSPSECLAAREEARLVERCVWSLPAHYRDIIILRDYAGQSWKVIADAHGRPSEAAARMMHAKAIVELHKELRRLTRAS